MAKEFPSNIKPKEKEEAKMKKVLGLLFGLLLTLMCGVLAMPSLSDAECVKIQSGTLMDVKGNPITVGYDKYGYNYQAHIFNGLYENYSRPDVVVTEGTENLVMKWSDNWLANVDCNGDRKLDRGLDSKTGTSDGVSKGWLTNHFEGDYKGSDGELYHYTYFVKIGYVGAAPVGEDDPWGGDVSVGGKRIWGVYAVIEEIQTDHFGEYGGRLKFVSKLTGPGLGQF